MHHHAPVIELTHLTRRYGKLEAVQGLNLSVPAGCCYGFFGRNGSGKTTSIKCLLNLLHPTAGTVRVFGLDPRRHEVEVKSRLAYVPDSIAFYSWMTVRDTLQYLSSFRRHWNRQIESELLDRFQLPLARKANDLSRGQRTQLALIGAVCPEPELLVLDEPTSGLDPIVRREFIETVIGAYQTAGPEPRTVLISTHLISEFEGLIDRFTIIDQGRELLTMDADAARERYCRIRARFENSPPEKWELPGAVQIRVEGREMEILANGTADRLKDRIRAMGPEHVQLESLSLEEIFVASKSLSEAGL